MDKTSVPRLPSTKKRGTLRLIKAALLKLGRRSSGKSKSAHVGVETKGVWKGILGTMSLLRLHHQSPQLPITPADHTTRPEEESFQPPPALVQAPQSTYLSPSSSYQSLSRYTSAQNLQELDNSEDDVDDGDEMIDAKAEEFITNFYEQIRLQRLESMNRHKSQQQYNLN
ncbi:PREDICTED: uncharacterized protein LOC104605127 [Nelumbo nucifera]|uniref:Uncharacterized protein LOC104605127 n=1 Tax=Nelumbo nucifera TaxID=4432 RepID=A0A1U8Q710_NELNU|nr:PREDICTED: uncharacterized protein LOC104605127 [Nelumbo nucifera]